jgi:pyruvate formate lyase activating enzyme
LEAVVFSGGEPTLQKGLLDAVQRVQELGFRVALHTAGIYPQRLSELLPYLHWVGLDIKAPFTQYEKITGVAGSDKHPLDSVKRLIASGIPYEVRTTIHPYFLTDQNLLNLAESLAQLGVQHYVLQNCRVEHALDPSLRGLSGSIPVVGEKLLEKIQAWIPDTIVR